MTKTLTALTALAFAATLAGGAAAQTNGGAMASDKMAADHMAKKDGAMATSGAMAKTDGMKTGAMKDDGAMKKAKKKGKKPMAEGAMAQDAMAKK